MTLVLLLLMFAIGANALRVRARVGGHQRLQQTRAGWIRVELWRRARLVAHIDLSGRKTFPLPQETRTRVWCCAGVPLRCEIESLGLPAQVSDQIDSVAAAQFDGLFSAAFRCAPQGPASAETRRGMPWIQLSRL